MCYHYKLIFQIYIFHDSADLSPAVSETRANITPPICLLKFKYLFLYFKSLTGTYIYYFLNLKI